MHQELSAEQHWVPWLSRVLRNRFCASVQTEPMFFEERWDFGFCIRLYLAGSCRQYYNQKRHNTCPAYFCNRRLNFGENIQIQRSGGKVPQERDVTGKVRRKCADPSLFSVGMPTATNKGRLTTNRASELYIYRIELS